MMTGNDDDDDDDSSKCDGVALTVAPTAAVAQIILRRF